MLLLYILSSPSVFDFLSIFRASVTQLYGFQGLQDILEGFIWQKCCQLILLTTFLSLKKKRHLFYFIGMLSSVFSIMLAKLFRCPRISLLKLLLCSAFDSVNWFTAIYQRQFPFFSALILSFFFRTCDFCEVLVLIGGLIFKREFIHVSLVSLGFFIHHHVWKNETFLVWYFFCLSMYALFFQKLSVVFVTDDFKNGFFFSLTPWRIAFVMLV